MLSYVFVNNGTSKTLLIN